MPNSRQIGQTNPALLQLISENQESFLNMLNEPNADELNVSSAAPAAAAAATGGAGTPASADRSSSGGDATLYLTPQDHDAIERVSNMHKTKMLVKQKLYKFCIFPSLISAQRFRISGTFGVTSLFRV